MKKQSFRRTNAIDLHRGFEGLARRCEQRCQLYKMFIAVVSGMMAVLGAFANEMIYTNGYNYTERIDNYTWTFSVVDGSAEIGVRDDDGNPQDWDCAINPKPIGAVTIPRVLGGCPVTRIGRVAFTECANMTSVFIPTGIIDIAWGAFSHCTRLESVVIPDGVTVLNEGVFSSCSSLKEIYVPQSVTSVCWFAVGDCSSLASLALPTNLVEIDECAFIRCKALSEIYIPASVAKIGWEAFGGCENLLNIVIDSDNSCYSSIDGVLYDKDSRQIVKYPCGKKGPFVVPLDVTNILPHAFAESSGLTAIAFSSSMCSIGEHAFDACRGLDSLTIPQNIKRFGDWVFMWCDNVECARFEGRPPSGIENCLLSSDVALYYNEEFSEDWQKIIHDCGYVNAHSYNPASAEEFEYVVSNGFAIITAINGSVSDSVYIPETISGMVVVGIGANAFSNCAEVTSIMVPRVISYVGTNAFGCCRNLSSICFKGTPPIGLSDAGLLKTAKLTYNCDYECEWLTVIVECEFENAKPSDLIENPIWKYSVRDGLVWIKGVQDKSSLKGRLRIPDEINDMPVVGIDRLSFLCCGDLTSVSLPTSIIEIADSAFSGCGGLETVCLPYALQYIGESAFEGCESLTMVTIPTNVSHIGKSAFRNCISLTNIIVDANNLYYASVGGVVYDKGLTQIVCFPSGREGVFSIPENVTNIAEQAFADCHNITSVVISSNIVEISYEAFYGCENLVAVSLSEGVCRLDDGAFGSCYSLSSITLPDSITSIGERVFSNCDELSFVSLGDGLRSIGSSAFEDCRNLQTITIPTGVMNIGEDVIRSCNNLRSINVVDENACFASVDGVVYNKCLAGLICFPPGRGGVFAIPANVTNIATGAFAECKKLRSVKMADGVVSIEDRAFCGCENIKSISLAGSLTDIGDSAFYWCRSLETMVIPHTTISIGRNAFGSCDALSSVDFEGAPPEGLARASIKTDAAIRYNVAYEDEWLSVIDICGFTNAVPYVPQMSDGGPYIEVVEGVVWTFIVTNREAVVASIPKDVVGKVSIPSSLGGRTVTGVDASAFCECSGLTCIVVPSSVVSIGTKAFNGCTMMRKIEFEGDPPNGWLNAIPGAWAKIYYNKVYDSEWKDALNVAGIEDGISYAPGVGSDSEVVVSVVELTVTNVVVRYVLNSVQPNIAIPVSGDVGFVTAITEVRSSGAVSVPSEWRDNYPIFTTKYGSDFSKALMMKSGKKDGAGNDMFVWQDFVAGTDPTDENDKFTASITIVDGVPVVSYSPELVDEQKALRIYKTFGKKQLYDNDWDDITDLDGESKKPYNFFKVTIEMR